MSRDNQPDDELDATAPMPAGPGESLRIGPYVLREKVGEGGMGEVWLAEQEQPIRRRVALKLIKQGMDTKQVVARFEAERQALAMMDHPAIAKIFDAGDTPQGRPYFVMEYVQGIPITDHCDRQKLTNRHRLDLFMQVCEGVQHAHQKAVIHRDLKPSNVLIAVQDGKAQPKIIDFGVAKATAQKLTDQTMYTQLGLMVGTPAYMSPEQADPSGQDIDTRTDVYALGVILYELLVGALPFDAKEFQQAGYEAIVRKIREDEPPRPSTRLSSLGDQSTQVAQKRQTLLPALKRELSGDLDWITLKALEKDRARRYASPLDLERDLRRYLANEPVLASPPSVAYRLRKLVRRHRVAVVTGTVLILALIGGIAGTTIGLLRARAAEQRAQKESMTARRVATFMGSVLQAVDPQEMGKALRADLESRTAGGRSLSRVNLVDVAQEMIDKQFFARASEMIERDLKEDPAIASELYGFISDAYCQGVLLYGPAVEAAERALQRAVEAGGPECDLALQAKWTLAWALFHRGTTEDRTRGSHLLEEYIAVAGPRMGRESQRILDARMGLADMRRMLGQREQSEAEFREIIPVMRRVLDHNDPVLYYALNDLAGVLRFVPAKQAEAESLYAEAIGGLQRIKGASNYETLNVRNNLLKLLRLMDRNEEIIETAGGLIEAMRAEVGEESNITVEATAMLAAAHAKLGHSEESLRWYQQSIEFARPARLRDPSIAATTSDLMVYMWSVAGHMKEAEKNMLEFERELRFADRDALQLKATYFSVLYNLGCLVAQKGERERGLNYLAQSIDAGMSNVDAILQDSDLNSLHGAEFDALIERARANAKR